MSIENISSNLHLGPQSPATDKPQQGKSANQISDAALERQQLEASSAQSQGFIRSTDPVQVSETASRLSQAVKNAALEGEDFDKDKVNRIRESIKNGKFPIDEERLAQKFLELERELGSLRK